MKYNKKRRNVQAEICMGVEVLRCAQHDKIGFPCHPERSERPLMVGVEVLRCAQHDKIPCHPERSEGSGWMVVPAPAGHTRPYG